MADWIGNARSNYFKVKNQDVFKIWLEELRGCVLIEQNGKFAITAQNTDNGGWPKLTHPADEKDLDFVNELSKHLEVGEVAVLMEIGSERLKYLTGEAIAVDCFGQQIKVSLDDVYAKVKEIFNADTNFAQY